MSTPPPPSNVSSFHTGIISLINQPTYDLIIALNALCFEEDISSKRCDELSQQAHEAVSHGAYLDQKGDFHWAPLPLLALALRRGPPVSRVATPLFHCLVDLVPVEDRQKALTHVITGCSKKRIFSICKTLIDGGASITSEIINQLWLPASSRSDSEAVKLIEAVSALGWVPTRDPVEHRLIKGVIDACHPKTLSVILDCYRSRGLVLPEASDQSLLRFAIEKQRQATPSKKEALEEMAWILAESGTLSEAHLFDCGEHASNSLIEAVAISSASRIDKLTAPAPHTSSRAFRL